MSLAKVHTPPERFRSKPGDRAVLPSAAVKTKGQQGKWKGRGRNLPLLDSLGNPYNQPEGEAATPFSTGSVGLSQGHKASKW